MVGIDILLLLVVGAVGSGMSRGQEAIYCRTVSTVVLNRHAWIVRDDVIIMDKMQACRRHLR